MDLDVLPSGLKTILSEDGLQVRIYYLECMAQATYIVSHEGAAFIIDPRRDVDAYIKDLQEHKLTLKGVLETHFHADFVSGHCELSQRTGATIYFGPGSAARTQFDIHELQDNEMIEFTSRYAIKALHTPGHTPESVVYILVDKTNDNRPMKAFTGDTLFIGSCGRPDLVGSIGFTAVQMASLMFSSLTNKISSLPDDVQLGVQAVSKELSSVPSLPPAQFKALMDTGSYTVLDTRSPREFPVCHIPGSLSFALGGAGGAVVGPEDGNFAIWVGTLVPSTAQLLIVADAGREGETLQRLSRIGYTNVKAVLLGGIASYKESGLPVDSYERINLETPAHASLESLLATGHRLLDVRTQGEFSNNSATSATNLPLASLPSLMESLDKSADYITFCVSGYRSAIATSLLRKAGFKVRDIYGGFAAISVYAPTHTTTGSMCPTMKAIIDSMQL